MVKKKIKQGLIWHNKQTRDILGLSPYIFLLKFKLYNLAMLPYTFKVNKFNLEIS